MEYSTPIYLQVENGAASGRRWYSSKDNFICISTTTSYLFSPLENYGQIGSVLFLLTLVPPIYI